ncbi:MAG: hypothetical protein H6713_18300 [Myxococcales bacterium]|nr:hypothetical protein [Myxococcales bacterium]
MIRLCANAPVVYGQFLRVLHMHDGLGAVRPEILRKVVAHAIGRRRPGGPAQANAAELPPVVPTQQPTGALPAGRSTRS